MNDIIANYLSKIDEVTSEYGSYDSMEELRLISRYISFLEEIIIGNGLYSKGEYIMEEFATQNGLNNPKDCNCYYDMKPCNCEETAGGNR